MSVKTEDDRLQQGVAVQDGSSVESRGVAEASLPKVTETDRHLALWEKQIKDTEKQIQNLEEGKKDRGVYSWLVGADEADDKALTNSKTHLEELKKSEKELRETGNVEKSKSELKRLLGKRGEELEVATTAMEEVAFNAEVGGKVAEGIRTGAVFTSAIMTGGAATGAVTAGLAGYGVIASGVAGLGAGMATGAVTSASVGAVTRAGQEGMNVKIGLKTEEQAYEDLRLGVGEDLKSGAIAGASSFAGLKVAGQVGAKLGARAESYIGSAIVGSSAGAGGGVVGSSLGTADALIQSKREFNETYQGSESERQKAYEEFMLERGLDPASILQSIGQGTLAGASGGAFGGAGNFARSGMTSRVARGATMAAQALGAGGSGLAVAGLDGEITIDEVIEEISFAIYGDVIGEMGVRHVRAQNVQARAQADGTELGRETATSKVGGDTRFLRLDGTDVGGVATAHLEFGRFVERAREQGFEVRVDEALGTSAHVDVNAREVVIGRETSWATLQHESAHVDLLVQHENARLGQYEPEQERAGDDLAVTANRRNYSEIDSLDSSDPLLANALRVAKGAGLSDQATHETVAVMRELEILRVAGVPETDFRYRQTMDYALAHWEVELSKIPEGQRTPEQQVALDVTQDSRTKLNLPELVQKNSNDLAEKSFAEEGVYRASETGRSRGIDFVAFEQRLGALAEIGAIANSMIENRSDAPVLVEPYLDRLHGIEKRLIADIETRYPKIEEDLAFVFSELEFLKQKQETKGQSNIEVVREIEERLQRKEKVLSMLRNPDLKAAFHLRSLTSGIEEASARIVLENGTIEQITNLCSARNIPIESIRSVEYTPFSVNILVEPNAWVERYGRGVKGFSERATVVNFLKAGEELEVARVHENIHSLQHASFPRLNGDANFWTKDHRELSNGLDELAEVLRKLQSDEPIKTESEYDPFAEDPEEEFLMLTETNAFLDVDSIVRNPDSFVDSLANEVTAHLLPSVSDWRNGVLGNQDFVRDLLSGAEFVNPMHVHATASREAGEILFKIDSLRRNQYLRERAPDFIAKLDQASSGITGRMSALAPSVSETLFVAERLGGETYNQAVAGLHALRPSEYSALKEWLVQKCGQEKYDTLATVHDVLYQSGASASKFSSPIGDIDRLSKVLPHLSTADFSIVREKVEVAMEDFRVETAQDMVAELVTSLGKLSAEEIDQRLNAQAEKLTEVLKKLGLDEEVEALREFPSYWNERLIIAGLMSGVDVVGKYENHPVAASRAEFVSYLHNYIKNEFFISDLKELADSGAGPTPSELSSSALGEILRSSFPETYKKALAICEKNAGRDSETSHVSSSAPRELALNGLDAKISEPVQNAVNKFLDSRNLSKFFTEYPSLAEKLISVSERIANGELGAREGVDAIQKIMSGLNNEQHLRALNATIGDALLLPLVSLRDASQGSSLKEVYEHMAREVSDYQIRRQRAEEKFKTDFRKFVASHHRNNEGQEAVIYFVEDGELLADIADLVGGVDLGADSAAVRVLKVYNPNKAYREFEIQQEAHQLLADASKTKGVSLVPKTLVHTEMELTDQATIDALKREGIDVSAGKVGVVVMEAIPGRDLQDTLLRKALEEHNKTALSEEQVIELEEQGEYVSPSRIRVESIPDDPSLLYQVAGKVFDFVTAKNQENAGDRFLETSTNVKKVSRFLAERGIKINPQIIAQLKSGIGVLNNGGIFHNDLHARNVMVIGDIFDSSSESGAQSYIIDFGFASDRPTTGNKYSDLSITEQIKDLA